MITYQIYNNHFQPGPFHPESTGRRFFYNYITIVEFWINNIIIVEFWINGSLSHHPPMLGVLPRSLPILGRTLYRLLPASLKLNIEDYQ